MEEKYLLKLDGEYYVEYYCGEVDTSSFKYAKRFDSKGDIFKEIRCIDWLQDDIKEDYKIKEIINIIE